MICSKVEQKINEQINAEIYSSYLYLSMSAYFESMNLEGFASWMRVQAQEELFHSMKFFDYINERGGKVRLTQIDAPPVDWENPLAVFKATLEHEQKVTHLINDLYTVAQEERDHASCSFLQWFIDEQVEEEASADRILSQLNLAEGDKQVMFMLDRELGQRVFTPPAQ